MPDSSHNLKQNIKDTLIKQFRTWPLETRLPSVRALAAELNVAYLTVDGAMRELEWEGYVRRVPRKGAFLASRERTVRRDLETGTSKLRAVVFAYPNYFSYATWARLRCAEEQAVRRGMALIEFKLNPETSYDGLAEVLEQRGDVMGVVVIPIPGSVSRRETRFFDSLGVPVVILAACEYVSLARRVWSVTTDWYRSGYLKANQLLQAGHQRIAYVQHEPTSTERQGMVIKGMRQALREAGSKQRDLVVVSGATRPWDDSRESARQLTRELIEDGTATAAMYESMRGVQGGLRAVREAGLAVPDDFAVISIGRGNGDEDYFSPPVTTVDPQPEAELVVAFDCLLNAKDNPTKCQSVPPVLMKRRSVDPAASHEPDRSSPGEGALARTIGS